MSAIELHAAHAPLALILWDEELRIQRWTGAAEALFGWTEAEVLGRSVDDFPLIFPLDQEQVKAQVADQLARAKPHAVSCNRNFRKSGEVIHCEWYNSLQSNPDGTLQSMLSFVVDVTARERARRLAEEMEERYQLLTEATSDGVLIHENMVILDANSRLAELIGYPREELIGMNAAQLLHPDSVERARTAVAEQTLQPYEVRGRCRDGRLIEAEITPRLIRVGERSLRTVSVRDVSADRARERALKKSEATNRALFDNAAVAMIQTTPDGLFARANAAAEQFLCCGPGELVGKSFCEVTHPDCVGESVTLVDQLFRGETTTFTLEKRYLRKDGSTVWGNLTASLIRQHHGEGNCLLAIIEDLTLRKRAEAERDALLLREQQARADAEALVLQRTAELASTRAQLVQQERLAMAGQLAAGVAHEVNNPLAFIVSNLEFIKDELPALVANAERSDREELLSALSDAQVGAGRIRDIVNELKAFAREDAGEPRAVALPQAIDFAVAMAMPQIRHRAQLVKDFQPAPQVLASDTRLGQVLLNLLVNAAQAIPEGVASANTITVRTRTSERGEAVVEVVDTGAGIAKDTLARIFEPFFTTKAQNEGTGLGLAICLGIVESLGGRIEVESELGRGSTFRVVLPAAPAQASQEESRVLKRESTRVRARVLVVDDEPGITNTVRRVLASEHEVTLLNRGDEAVRLLQSGAQFDAILCDLMMPELTGADVYDALKASRPDLCDRFILMTGGAFTERGGAMAERPGLKTLSKPFTLEALKAQIEACAQKANPALRRANLVAERVPVVSH